ncbi:MAG: ABC transporter permease, partial [Dehalococcoidia bacterium]
SMIPAIILGVAGAYFGGLFDYVTQRVVDAVQAIPGLILLIAIMIVLGPSLFNVVIALSVGNIFRNSRVVRGAALGIFNNSYFDAARVIGASPLRVMFRHMLPNIVPTIIVVASLGFGQLIIAEASVSFLGYGIQPPTPSWGNMLSADGRAYMYAQPWMLAAPALALALVVFGVNMFGDAVRDLIDPRLRGS